MSIWQTIKLKLFKKKKQIGALVIVTPKLKNYVKFYSWSRAMERAIYKVGKITDISSRFCDIEFISNEIVDEQRHRTLNNYSYPLDAVMVINESTSQFKKNEMVLATNDFSDPNSWVIGKFKKYNKNLKCFIINVGFLKNENFQYCIKLNGNEHLVTQSREFRNDDDT